MARVRSEKFEVLLNENAQAALDNFSTCFGVRIAYFNPDHTELKVGLKKPGCKYCGLLRQELYGHERCFQQDRSKLAEAFQRRTLIHYTCHGGLVEAICPVIFGQTLVGYVMAGQFRVVDRLPGQIRDDALKKWGSCDQLRKAFLEVPHIPAERLAAMLGIFSLLVKAIISEGIVTVKGDLMVERILHEIRNRPERPPTLDEAARLVGRSHSSVSHLFKEKLGRSFKSCIVDIRIEKAGDLLKHEPGISVKQVAAQVGYVDVFYFSRIFRQRKGVPPSRYL